MESVTKCICAFSTATTPGLGFGGFTPEFFGTLGVIFPLAAYPFMFSDRGRTCQHVLGLTAMSSLIVQMANSYAWAMGYKHAEFPLWLCPLAMFSAFVSLWDAEGHESDVNWQPVPFVDREARYVIVTFYMFLSYIFTHLVSLFEAEPATSMQDAFHLVALVFVVARFATDIYADFTRATAMIYHRLATRRVPGWFWIHADEPGLFRPMWSVVLTVIVGMSAPVLTVLWMFSVWYIVPISGTVSGDNLLRCHCT
ncbi:hypothetical protein F4814DRAFT_26513 [Daldinia grandis]|nr:hypothetical protein F4814DRAFT_26513 [Daldinia grandis]